MLPLRNKEFMENLQLNLMLKEFMENLLLSYLMIILKMSEVKYKTKHGEGPQLLSPKQIFRILPTALSQVKFKANFYSLYRTK